LSVEFAGAEARKQYLWRVADPGSTQWNECTATQNDLPAHPYA